VHVGDVLSLAVNLARQQLVGGQQQWEVAIGDGGKTKPTGEKNEADDSAAAPLVFPSPKHRVLSPTSEKRASLVYFAYPPPDLSIRTVSERLVDWCSARVVDVPSPPPPPRPSTNTGTLSSSGGGSVGEKVISIPYDEYYLLANQQELKGGGEEFGDASDLPSLLSRARDRYEAIKDTPIGKVLERKWQQVQRAEKN